MSKRSTVRSVPRARRKDQRTATATGAKNGGAVAGSPIASTSSHQLVTIDLDELDAAIRDARDSAALDASTCRKYLAGAKANAEEAMRIARDAEQNAVECIGLVMRMEMHLADALERQRRIDVFYAQTLAEYPKSGLDQLEATGLEATGLEATGLEATGLEHLEPHATESLIVEHSIYCADCGAVVESSSEPAATCGEGVAPHV